MANIVLIVGCVVAGVCSGLALAIAIWCHKRKPFTDDYEWTSERGF